MKIISSIITLFLTSTFILAQLNISDELDARLREGIKNLVNANYTQAYKIFDEIDKKNPGIPLGKLYLAALEITKCEDYGINFNVKYIESLLNGAIEQSNKILKEKPNSIDGYYYQALANGYFGYFHSIEKNYFTAFKYGLNSLNQFEDCLKRDKKIYDSYIAIGSYKYWKSRKMSWVPFVTDETAYGIDMLKKSLSSNAYNKHLALYSLIWVYIEEEKPKIAIKYAEDFLKDYPENRLVKLALARAYQDVNIDKSIELFKELLYFYQNNEYSKNKYKEIVIMHKLAQLYQKKGKTSEAKNLCKTILNIKLDKQTEKRLEKRIQNVKELLEELS
ncbi:MAG TPA: hypothetical protein PLI27_08045 [Ignavibacteriales bacterium]|nr:hypothetical protein [Ignavibacteriales bacterium]HOL82206.1 hypothetical protein [Ignavibacteriales bacterium]HPD68008.1 hypothetical protein [Ignavibacteriales bacterium]HPP34577.1 hypothetical protein [Ignavibacteriales bacterium]HRR18031.1 hypothetical protein [Ignavibacteriales bacterium]